MDILEARKNVSIPQKRLSLNIRFAVRIGFSRRVSVLKLNEPTDNIAVRIALHDILWTRCIVKMPDLSKAIFCIDDIKVLVRSHIDVCGAMTGITPIDYEAPLASRVFFQTSWQDARSLRMSCSRGEKRMCGSAHESEPALLVLNYSAKG